MNYTLRDYQLKAKKMTYAAIKNGDRKVIDWINMGGGKGLLMPYYAKDALKMNKKTLVVMRRRDLIFQTKENFKKYCGINASIIMGTEPGFDPSNFVQICSIDTLRTRIKKPEYAFLKDFDVIQIDECHDTTSPSYQRLFEFLGDKIYVGFTATPFATGNKPLLFWDIAVQPIKPSELRDRGFLVRDRFFRPGTIDTTGIKKVNGDYSVGELYELVTDLKIIGDAIESYKKYGQNKPFVGFCVNKAHSKLMAHAFNDAGIPCIHIDESHNAKERKFAKDSIENGTLRGVWNVNIFSTGWDCPIISVLIGLRPTLSEILALQQWGRPLRTHENKEYAIILDHADNCSRHGFPYDDNRQAVLTEYAHEFKKKEDRKEKILVKDCPECMATIENHRKECPFCNYAFQVAEREIKQEEGELVEVDQNENKKANREFERIKKHLDKLIDKQKANGWKETAKYFMLHSSFGNIIFNYIDELGIPKWIEGAIKKNQSTKRCKNCKKFNNSISNMPTYDNRFENIKLVDIGYCRKFGVTMKKNSFCIMFNNRNKSNDC